jgi:hypothetical protein
MVFISIGEALLMIGDWPEIADVLKTTRDFASHSAAE